MQTGGAAKCPVAQAWPPGWLGAGDEVLDRPELLGSRPAACVWCPKGYGPALAEAWHRAPRHLGSPVLYRLFLTPGDWTAASPGEAASPT